LRQRYLNVYCVANCLMKKYKGLFFVLALFLLPTMACKKELINAHRITSTDSSGNLTGDVDASDWRFDDSWNSKEQSLFNFGTNLNTTGLLQSDTNFAIAYPNPAMNAINFYFSTSQPTLVKWVITDEKLKPLLQNYFFVSGSYNFMIDLTGGQFATGSY